MIKKYSILLAVVIGLTTNIYAQSEKTVLISGTRFVLPLVEKWIQEFNKEYPGIKVALAPQGTVSDSLDLQIVAYNIPQAKIKQGKNVVKINRYAQLPVANPSNPLLTEYSKTGLTKEKFKQLYFAEANAQSTGPVTIYKRETQACASVAFAEYFGEKFDDIQGTKVTGDDKTLIESVKKDINGITYNNLGFVYNLQTRKVNEGLAVIPLDLNNNGKLDEEEKIYDNLDKVLAKIYEGTATEIPVDYVRVIFAEKATNPNASFFLSWVLRNSEKLNKANGYLNLPESEKVKSLSIAETLKK